MTDSDGVLLLFFSVSLTFSLSLPAALALSAFLSRGL